MRLTSQVHSCSNNAATARRVARGKSNNEVKAGILNPACCTEKSTFPATLKTHPRSHQHIYISVMISANSDLVYPSIHTYSYFGGCLVAEVARVNHWVKLRFLLRFLQPRSLNASCCHREKSPPWWTRKTRHPSPWFGMVDVVGRSANIEQSRNMRNSSQRQYPLVICYIAIENGH